MATPELKFKLSIDGKEFVGALDDAGNRVKRFGDGVATSGARASSSVQGITGHLATMAQAAAGAFAIGKLSAMTDAYASLNARVGLASQGIGSAAVAQQKLFEIANQSRVGVAGLSEVYVTLARAAGELGVSQTRVLGMTETLSKAMTLSGGSAESARAAMVQFGQGLSAGALRGEELNSVLEQAPRLAEALAEGLGRPQAALRGMAEQGLITTDAIFVALERMSGKIDAEFAQLPTTVGQAMTVMQNSLLQTIGVFDQASGVSRGFAEGVLVVARNMDAVALATGTVAAAYVVLRTSALAATLATQGLAVAQGLLLGPIGLIATALGFAGAAWLSWHNNATASEKAVEKQVVESDVKIIARIQNQIDKLNERNTLAGAPIPQSENQTALDAARRYTDAYTKFQDLISGTDAPVGASEATLAALLASRTGRIAQAGQDVAAAYTQYSDLADAMNRDASGKTTAARTAFMATYQTSGDKLAAQIAAYDKQFLGKVTEQQRAQDIAAIKASAPKAAGIKAVSDAYGTLSASIAQDLQATQQQIDQGSTLAASDKFRLDTLGKIEEALRKKNITSAQAVQLEGAMTAAEAARRDVEGTAARTKAYEASEKARQTYTDGQIKGLDALQAEGLALQSQIDRLGLSKTAVAELDAAQLELQASKLDGLAIDRLVQYQDKQQYELYKQQAAQLRANAALLTNRAGREAGIDDAAAIADANKTAADESRVFWTDSLMRAFESGKGFFDVMYDSIKNKLKTDVLRVFVQPVAGALSGALGLSSSASAGQGGSGMLGMASNAYSLYSTFGGAAAATGAATTASIASAFTSGVSAGAAGLTPLVAMNATTGMAVGGATATAGGLGAQAGAALGSIGPVGWAVLAAVTVAAMFGGRGPKESTGGGIEGNFSNAGFSGNNFSTWSQDGGWFRSDRSGKDTSALDANTSKQWTDAYAGLQLSAAQAAVSLGLSADAIKNYSQSISLQLGADAAANERAIAALFTDIGNNMALAAAPGIGLLSKESEAAGDTMVRLSTSITTANAWLSILRQRLFQVSLAGGDAASKLADAFGGLENLTAASASFYELYYTEGERLARTQEDMARALDSVNLAMPATKDGLRALAGSLDLNTESGRTAYAVLLALAPEFAAAADLTAKFSRETAAQLMQTFTGRGLLIPALDATQLQMTSTAARVGVLTDYLGRVSAAPVSASVDLVNRYLASVNASPISAELSRANGYLTGLDGRPVNTSIAAVNAYLEAVNGSPVSVELSRINGYLTGVNGAPVDSSIAGVNTYLAAIKSLPVGASIASVNAALTGVNGLPVNAAIAAANSYLASVNASPLSIELSRLNGYLTNVNSQPVGAAIIGVNAALASVNTLIFGGTMGSINAILGNAGSGVLYFGDIVSGVNAPLTSAQLAAQLLTGQIEALRLSADRTRIDFVGLGAALQGVNTATFVNTLTLVFESLATRISGVIDSIGAERIAVREAALQIINPTVMTRDAIQRGIAGINTALPGNAGVVNANAGLVTADQAAAAAQRAAAAAGGNVGAAQNNISGAQNSLAQTVNHYKALADYFQQTAVSFNGYQIKVNATGTNNDAYTYQAESNTLQGWNDISDATQTGRSYGHFLQDAQRFKDLMYGNGTVQALSGGSAALAAAAQAVNTANAALGPAQAALAAANASANTASAARAAAEQVAAQAVLAYTNAMQDFSIDASKSVGKLTRLREETVKYYEAQNQLANLMATSAAGLRGTVADYRYSQLSDAQQLDKLQADYARAYSMALSTDGEMLAGYGDTLSSALNPMLEKAREVLSGNAYDAFAATALARAEVIAGRLETLTPTDYVADSLAMLGSIDATLAALDASSKSAEAIISDAIRAGADATSNGLRAVIAAITGQAIPAFAAGGMHSGGVRLVGERGPELEVTGPSRIFNAQQTRGMLSGGSGGNTARLEALVEQLVQENAAQRAELRAIAISNKKLVDYADRADVIGVGVRNQPGLILKTEVVA